MVDLTGDFSAAAFEVIVVDPDPRYRTRLVDQLGGGVAAYRSVEELAERLRPNQPAVVVFGPGVEVEVLPEIEKLTRARPEIGAILAAQELSTGLLQQALRSGVRDVIGFPAEAQLLHEAVARVGAMTVVPTGPVVAGPAPERGRVITISSTKGGSGKSVVATNLAVVLAKRVGPPGRHRRRRSPVRGRGRACFGWRPATRSSTPSRRWTGSTPSCSRAC